MRRDGEVALQESANRGVKRLDLREDVRRVLSLRAAGGEVRRSAATDAAALPPCQRPDERLLS
jgi:hypothetical protein